ncbi:hypothetical protein RhiTH_000047 [Rhizoctonia solani]
MPPNSPTHTSEQSRCWITEINISHVKADPECKFSGQIFVEEDVVCSLPWIESTVPLKWSGLLPWNAPLSSEITLRVCRSVKDKSRHYYFPPFSIPEVDETGELTLALSEARWSATIKFLTLKAAEHLFPSALEKLNLLEDEREAPNPEAAEKGLFKHVLQFTRFATEVLPEPTIKVSLVIVMNTWELLDQQAQLDERIKSILQHLICIRDVNDMTHRVSSSALASATGSSEEPIRCILGLLEQISIYMHNQLSTNNLVCIPTDKEEHGDTDSMDEDLARLKDLAVSFRDSWMPMGALQDTNNPVYNDQPDITNQDTYAEATIPDRANSFGMLNHGASIEIDPHEILDLLRPAEPSGYDPDQACLDGTREAILATLIKWTQTRHTSESLMWISGQVGMGKTAIATSLCQRLHNARALAASFFFQPNDPESSSPLRLFNNLIRAIAIQCPPYAQEVAKAIRMDRGLCTSHVGTRYEYLIKRPLQKLRSLSFPATLSVVIDGLSESGEYDTRERTLHMLYEMSRLVPWLKIVIAARPTLDIQAFFENHCPDQPIIHVQDYDAASDIRAYIIDKLGLTARQDYWPQDSMDKLGSMAQGVFLWAALAVRYIKSSMFPSLPRLHRILNNQKSPVTDRFDAVYTKALETAMGGDNDVKEAFRQCTGAIIATSEREPLALPDLQYLILVAGRIDPLTLERVAKSLATLLLVTEGQRSRFHHPSFKDFITTPSRSGQFRVQPDRYETEPAVCCLQVMHRDLRFNICKLETSHLLNSQVPDLHNRIESCIGPALKYACMHWIDHLIASPSQMALNELKKLLEGPQVMYWIEVLSLLGYVNEAVLRLSDLMSLELTQVEGWAEVVPWIKDLHRFILSFYDAISTSTPHIYISALAFAPCGSLTAQRMRHYFPNTIWLAQSSSPLWHPCVKANSYHQAVQSLSISPNGKMVITGHLDGSVCLQDAQTRSHISGPLVGHTNPVTCITFSGDGKLAASSSYDTTIRLWDVSLKAEIASHVLAGHSGPVNSVTFHPGAALLASGSSDRTIRFWNTKSMSPIGLPYTEHSGSVTSVMFSLDGAKLVSGLSDRTIRVWSVDIVDQKLCVNPLVITGHSDSITCVAVSPDGTKVLSGSIDKTVQMWDAGTGKETSCKPQTNHHMSITCVRFSPCGKLVASSSLDGGIQLYSTKTMSPAASMFHHTNSVNSIEFLPNGLYVMSGSSDMTTRMWEINRLPRNSNCHRDMAVGLLVGHTSPIYCIAISSDGTRIISGDSSFESSIRMWDAQTGNLIGSPLTGHSSGVHGVAISPDNTHILSGSEDLTLKLWNTATQTAIHSYQHTSPIYCVAFSPDGTLIAFGCNSGDVYVFEAAGWKVPGTALRHSSSYAPSVAFSPDGATLASAYNDGSIALWNVATRSRSNVLLSGHTEWVRSVAFSPCGTQLASGSNDRTVRLWNVKTGDMIRELKGHTHWVMSVAFSHNGLYIASGSHDKTVRVWNAKSGELIGQPFAEHSDQVHAVAFSPDDNYLISGSHDKTISVQRISAPPGTFCWPLNPYNLSPHSHYPGWPTSNYEYLSFWLPPHYQQPDQFLSSSTENPCPRTLLDYSKFVQGDAWIDVASESIRQSIHSSP